MPRRSTAIDSRLTQSFSQKILERGLDLYASGKVLAVTHEPGFLDEAHFEGEVLGSSHKLYTLSLTFYTDDIASFCSCPYEFQCKHAAALAMKIIADTGLAKHLPTTDKARAHRIPADTKTAPLSAPDTLESWLSALAQPAPKAALRPLSERAQNWHLSYFLDFPLDYIALRIVERYMEKDGEWGSQIREVSARHALAGRKGLTSHDRHLLATLADVQGTLSHDDYRGTHYKLHGPFAYAITTEALASGNAFHADSLRPLKLGPERHLSAQWVQQNNQHRVALQLNPEPSTVFQLLNSNPALYACEDQVGLVQTDLTTETIKLLQSMPDIPDKQLAKACVYLSRHVEPKDLPLPKSVAEIQTIDQCQIKATLTAINYKNSGFLPALALTACYGHLELPLAEKEAFGGRGSSPQEQVIVEERQCTLVVRQHHDEYAACQALRRLGLGPYHYEGVGELWVPPEIHPENHLIAWNRIQPSLQRLFEEQNWSVEWDEHYQNQQHPTQISAQFEDHSSGWFNFQLDITVAGVSVPTVEVISRWLALGAPEKMAVLNAEQRWIMADMSSLQPIFTTLKELFGSAGKPSRKLPNFRISAFTELDNADFRGAPQLKKLQKDLQDFKGLKTITPPKTLNATLRDYQQQGLNWLMFLHHYRFGGILADDMGLGKTLQALAFLQKIKTGRKLQKGALVVAPTSLIWNWEAEAEKFTPRLNVLVLHGSDRHELFDWIPEYDLVITSYPLLHRDIEVYANIHFDVVILDEAQNVKNPLAKTARAVRRLQADMRLALTGTPLENHLGELWSIMDFALPSLLGNSEFFQQHFRKPIETDRDMERNRDLAQRAAPFMLRRTKQAVATELPDKTEIVQHVHLEKDQQSLYESIRISMEKKVRALIKAKGMARSHIEFLDALLKLRQTCIDPRLVKLQQAKKAKTSAKMNWLLENLPEMIEEGRKVLVFSQFTQMLGLIEREIERLKIPYTKLTGQTKNRKTAVEQFQSGTVPVFLISLKAGGSGLNLTAADTVIHVDPWWNPAVENQATDRAYRIGQDKPVFVYKLVAAGTVEEKIQTMQEHKQSLADALFDDTQKTKLPKSGDELLALFS